MKLLSLMLLAVLVSAGEALTPEQHEAWLEAMRKSAEVGKPTGTAQPRDPKSTPEYQTGDAANRDAEAERLRQEQARWKAEREAREKAAADEKARREAVAVEQWNERQRQLAEEERQAREGELIRERQRVAAENQELADKAARERWQTFGFIIAGIVGLILLVLPSVIASFRGSPQRPAIAGLVVCSLLSALAAGQQPAAAPAPILLFSAALALSLWRFRTP